MPENSNELEDDFDIVEQEEQEQEEQEREPTFVPMPKPLMPVLDSQSNIKTMKVNFWYPQSDFPEISIDGVTFIRLPYRINKCTLDIKVKGDDIFPFTCVFKNEGRTFRKQTFEYYCGIDATQVSIQRVKE